MEGESLCPITVLAEPFINASSPIVLSATSGNLTCPTCVTSSGGGALTATSPVLISGAGVISISGVTALQGNGAKLQLSELARRRPTIA